MEYPDEYCIKQTPALWNRKAKMVSQYNVLTHLIFLGPAESNFQFALSFLAHHQKQSDFLTYFKPLINPIIELKLEWAKLLNITTPKMVG